MVFYTKTQPKKVLFSPRNFGHYLATFQISNKDFLFLFIIKMLVKLRDLTA